MKNNKMGNVLFPLFFLTIMSLLLNNCDRRTENIINQEYSTAKSFFPEVFVDHFPKKLSNEIGVSICSLTETSSTMPLCLIVTDKICNKSDSLYISSLIDHSVVEYIPSDSSLLIVDRFRNQANELEFDLILSSCDSTYIDCDRYVGKLPVPNFFFSKYHSLEYENRLSDDFRIYVLESKSGKYWDKEKLKDEIYMPVGWEHGYSKGIALNVVENIIVYWFIIW